MRKTTLGVFKEHALPHGATELAAEGLDVVAVGIDHEGVVERRLHLLQPLVGRSARPRSFVIWLKIEQPPFVALLLVTLLLPFSAEQVLDGKTF
jgi:hypothetical protein